MLERDVTLVSGALRAAAFQTLLVKASTPLPCLAERKRCHIQRTRAWERLWWPGSLGTAGTVRAWPGHLAALKDVNPAVVRA